MKKFIALFLVAAMVLAIAGCGGSPSSSGSSDSSDSSSDSSSSESASGADTAETSDSQSSNTGDTADDSSSGGESGTLVVYFSATGNTAEAAGYIAELTGGDLFELVPAEPYSDEDLNYRDDDSRVSREYEDESLRDVELVSDTVENWDNYDTVFIGYPIWWGIAAWPVDTFVENNDFTGKTVIPFCTSASSGLGDSAELLAELAGTGDWQEGERFRSSVSEENIREWLEELGF